MGRAKKRSPTVGVGTVGAQDATRLPQDGPIHYSTHSDYAQGEGGAEDAGLTRCLAWLESCKQAIDGEETCRVASHANAEERGDKGKAHEEQIVVGLLRPLLSQLLDATRLKDQLQALQVFKSRLAQVTKERATTSHAALLETAAVDDGAAAPSTAADGAHPEIHEEAGISSSALTCLYRFLLESLCSAQTPPTLSRAIRSNLETLGAFLVDNNQQDHVSTIQEVQRSVLHSILVGRRIFWRDPCHALQEILLVLEPAILHQQFDPVWAFLADTAQIIQPAVPTEGKEEQQDEKHPIGKHRDDSVTVDRAVQLATLIKLVLVRAPPPLGNKQQRQATTLQGFLNNLLESCAVPAEHLAVVGIALGRIHWILQTMPTSRNESITTLLPETSHLAPLPRACLWQGLAATLPEVLWQESSLSLLSVLSTTFFDFHQATDPEVRLSALKGLCTLVSKSVTLVQQEGENKELQQFAEDTLQTVVQAWEHPPTRRLGNSIPALFESVVQLMKALDNSEKDESRFERLIQRLLALPPHCKGRYVAMEQLLPMAGKDALFSSSSSSLMMKELFAGLGDHGHNTGPIADLWASLLRFYYQNEVTTAWLDLWIPGLALALIQDTWTRRKQVAAFCLPRIATLTTCSESTAIMYKALLETVQQLGNRQGVLLVSKDRLVLGDRVLWAVLEIVRSGAPILRGPSVAVLRETVVTCTPDQVLRGALAHSCPTLRVAAFQVLPVVVETLDESDANVSCMQRELELWRYALPFAAKSSDKEYLSSILCCLLSLMDRLLQFEARQADNENTTILSSSRAFCVDFLIQDLFVERLAYPGTVADKESFGIALLECVLAFSARDQPLAHDSKLLPKTGSIFQRKRLPLEETTVAEIRSVLVSNREVMASIFGLLHSIWDGTQLSAFKLLFNLIETARSYGLDLPEEYTSDLGRPFLERRGLFLASSPRQREADTGSRLLAFGSLSQRNVDAKIAFLSKMVDLLEERLRLFQDKLKAILSDTIDLEGGKALPLPHGIIHALRLAVEHDEILRKSSHSQKRAEFDRMARLLCRAIRISLAVVADVRDGASVEGMDDELFLDSAGRPSEPKINPGAIGANGIFSSVNRTSDKELARCLASQRIVVGSWLLTKETCGALSILFASTNCVLDEAVMSEAGMLLISTLTSLKHTGAAFAAHRALQQLAQACLRSSTSVKSVFQLPSQWAARMLDEVSHVDQIRDSTLRRSTGYALGFLSIMRAEVSTKSPSKPLSKQVLSSLLRLSLPTVDVFRSFLSRVGLESSEPADLLPFLQQGEQLYLPETENYELRSRVHALNVLRSILLDAPLAVEVFPMVGDAIASAIIGYTDSEWAVRNSSTMVFAAAMLRSVDADKNSTNTDTTSRKSITVTELFRAYPSLPSFLLAVMNAFVNKTLGEARGMSLPPVLPILLLLARVQPVAQSGMDAISHVEGFVSPIVRCLEHRDLSIRTGAASALSNLSSDVASSSTCKVTIVGLCDDIIAEGLENGRSTDWNRVHGSLLAIRELVRPSVARGQVLAPNESLLKLIQLVEGRPRAPCPCLAVALEALADVSSVDASIAGRVSASCCQLIEWLEKQSHQPSAMVGAAELGTIVSSVVTSAVCSTISCIKSTADAVVVMQQLSRMLENDHVDIRIQSVKVFKKRLYTIVDTMVEEDARQLLEVLSLATVNALRSELLRDHAEDDLVGSHAPTLRRLSRCVLECVDAMLRTGSILANTEVLGDLSETSALLLDQANVAFLKGSASDAGHALTLTGNAFEMISYVLASGSTAFSRRFFLFGISRMVDPTVHWRVRHSACTALHRSKLLSDSHDEVPAEVFLAAFEFLQDMDADVRYAAARVISNRSQEVTERQCAELILMRTFLDQSTISDQALFRFASKSFVDLKHTLLGVLDGWKPQDKLDESIVASQRKIFEEEEPNSYREAAVATQLAVRALVQKSNSALGEVKSATVGILEESTEVLAILSEFALTESHVLIGEVTRHNALFPALHSALLVTATILYVTENDGLTTFGLEETPGLHPRLRQVLGVLNNPANRQSILDCCFLVRSHDGFHL